MLPSVPASQVPCPDYDAKSGGKVPLDVAEQLVGADVLVPLTGRVTRVAQSPGGTYVRILLDERWGFDGMQLNVDVEGVVRIEGAS